MEIAVSIEDSELKIGGQTFKGAWIAVVLAIGSTIGGGVWTASSLYSRLESVEVRQIPDVQPMQESIQLIQQQLRDNDISQLSAKLATLGTNLATILEQQEKLLELKAEVSTLSNEIESMKGTVAKAEVIADGMGDIDDRLKVLNREAQDLWDAVQFLSDPLR
jgi:predicted  nucleic acid-binding Zn-ribbon protein